MNTPRPAQVCRALLAGLAAAEGRSRARKRDQTADAIGLNLRRELLMDAVHDDPEPDAFERWLLGRVESSPWQGAMQATARALFDEWQLAFRMDTFAAWLEQGAPSEDGDRADGRRA